MENLSSAEFAAFDRRNTAILIAISPLESHGAHLPLGVDYFNAIFFAERLANLIAESNSDRNIILFPAIPFGTNVYNLPGSVRTDAISIFKILYDLGRSMARWNFKHVFILSGHGSPKHIVAIDAACKKAYKKHGVQMHNISGNLAVRFLHGEFTDHISELMADPIPFERKQLLKFDLHGGWWETSMMLLLKPELVKPDYRNLAEVRRPKKGGTPQSGYYGSPALADTDFAEASIKVMASEALVYIEKVFNGELVNPPLLSPLYKYIFFRPYFRQNIIISLILILLISFFTILAWTAFR